MDNANADFWQELCGSNAALMLGIEDASRASLDTFDSWYLNFYPYLRSIFPERFADGTRVLEVGLGYGTIASYLMRSGARYFGLNVASAPVEMAKHRSDLLGHDNKVIEGSILKAPSNLKHLMRLSPMDRCTIRGIYSEHWMSAIASCDTAAFFT